MGRYSVFKSICRVSYPTYVTIILTLGNAAQVAFDVEPPTPDTPETAATVQPQEGPKVALGDTLHIDTLQANMLQRAVD